MIRVFRGFLLTAGILALCAGSAYAQGMGSIFGKVTDPSGGVLPGVTVTVSGPAIQRPMTTVTGESGAYQFPQVPIGTYTVTFELSGFKKASRPNVIITVNFNAPIDQKMEIGQVSEEMTVTAAAPVVDTKKTTTGGTYTKDILENIPTSRDPQQIINMAPGVQLSGINVGGSASGQQLTPQVYGTGNNVQWNLEGGSITDLSSNSSPSYFNFDSFEQIQVTTGGGDVSVQSSGISINLVTKSGSNVFKGSALGTFENDHMQANNVTQELFNQGGNGFLSGNPLQKITNLSAEYGGPIMRNRLWFWGAADRQDINVGVLNFFDPSKGAFCQQLQTAQKQGTLGGLVTYDKLNDVQNCLSNDRTLIKDLEWKFNYQLNAANKIQYLFTSDNKYRNRRNASSTRTQETTAQQTSDMPWGFPLPTHSLTHTLILTDKLVFNNQLTYVDGGFFLDYQDVPSQGSCLQSRYTGSSDINSYNNARQGCLWNAQQLTNATTGLLSRSATNSYQTVRKTWELKTDGTYFLTNKLGGDHSLKFGVGWRKAPILTYSHYSGGARANVQCVGNNASLCGDGSYVAAGSAGPGVVPRSAILYRDDLLNNNWWTYNGYIQDGYNHGKWRIQGGLRYDWQTSSYLGGCVPGNSIRPDLLPGQCEAATDSGIVINPNTGSPLLDSNGNPVTQKIPAFSVWAPRVSATYDLFGNGKTSIHASYSLYYQTKITLANQLGSFANSTTLTYSTNQSNGLCSTTAGASCWNDSNHDGIVQANELIGTPSANNSRFNLATGQTIPGGNSVDPNTGLQRTREFVTGVQHELVSNLAIGVDYVYRRYDHGSTGYTAGFQPGSSQFPLSNIYTGPLYYTDPTTGTQAPYYVICTGCVRPTAGTYTSTSLAYQTYQGIIPTLNKRFSNRWQMTASGTFQLNPQFLPTGSFVNPTGVVFQDGNNNSTTFARYVIKVNGVYALPWGINASGNLNVVDGNGRTLSVSGPGNVYGGVTSTGAAASPLTYNTLEFQPRGSTRLSPTKLLDLSAQKTFTFRGGKNRLKLMFDCFNVFNVNTILGYGSNTVGSSTFNNPSSLVPPRVFRVGAQIVF